MKSIYKSISILCFVVAVSLLFAACSKMKVGYLRTTSASFAPDSLNVYKNIDPESDQYKQKTPWVSTRIQGVAGTNPLNYELANVTSDNGGDTQLFIKLHKENLISVAGGMIVVSQDAVKQLPNGTYRLSLRVFNDDHSDLLNNIFRVIVADEEVFIG